MALVLTPIAAFINSTMAATTNTTTTPATAMDLQAQNRSILFGQIVLFCFLVYFAAIVLVYQLQNNQALRNSPTTTTCCHHVMTCAHTTTTSSAARTAPDVNEKSKTRKFLPTALVDIPWPMPLPQAHLLLSRPWSIENLPPRPQIELSRDIATTRVNSFETL